MATWTEIRPSEDFYRILAPDGTLEGDPPDLDDDELRKLYRTFVATRHMEDRMLQLQRQGEISIVSRSRGEEATPLGSAAALSPGDWIFPSYRQQAAALYWGTDLARNVAARMGAEPETIDEHLPADEDEAPAVNFTPVYVPLATNVMNGAGAAMADSFYDDRDTVTLAYIGDGSTSEGDFHEAMNFAGVFDAPIVTICQNNQWAISVPTQRQTASETYAQKADAYGMPGVRVDGNDVFAVYEKTKEAVERARAGDGPTFIECVTYRRSEHNTSDNPDVYRSEDEIEFWEERDPVDRFEAYLREEGVIDDETIAGMEEEIDEEIQAAIDAARGVPESDSHHMFDHHLHGQSWSERHQREELRVERAGGNPFTDFTGEGFE